MENVGKNTPASEKLREFVERMERNASEKEALAEDGKVIMAEAKAAGFSPKGLKHCLKVRKMKPQDWQEEQSIYSVYLHALGLEDEPPLLKAMRLASVDTTSHDAVIAELKHFTPMEGELIVKLGAKGKRLWRDKNGDVHVDDYEPPMPSGSGPADGGELPLSPGKRKAEVPDVSEDEAEDLGREAARENEPIVSNPFPYRDPRRARFDKGWCDETGSDGMGPSED